MNDQMHGFAALGFGGVRLAVIAGFDGERRPLVDIGAEAPVSARSLVPVEPDMVGREVAVVPLEGIASAVLILGVLQDPAADTGKRVVEADRELVLRCGKSSVTLTAEGRVTIKGKQVLSRAEGQNRVQGANVSLN